MIIKHSLLHFLFIFQSVCIGFTQTVEDLRVPTAENMSDRKAILDLAHKEFKPDVVLTVTHLKMAQNYAWFTCTVERSDKKPFEFPDDGYDCCHAEGLFVKKNGKWKTVEFSAFSTDCWYCDFEQRYPKVPKEIYR